MFIGHRRETITHDDSPDGSRTWGAVITAGDGARSGLSASARANNAATRADAREGVHLHSRLRIVISLAPVAAYGLDGVATGGELT